MAHLKPLRSELIARHFVLSGYVQGVGMRPAIVRLAVELDLTGWVCNSERGVEVFAEGPEYQVDQFLARIPSALSSFIAVEVLSEERLDSRKASDFRIVASEPARRLAIPVPLDVVTCSACCGEVFRLGERRTHYWLTTCCECGPRYTVIQSMPFERHQTAMANFPLCRECQQEWYDVRDRRFHAQTMACPRCGPAYCVYDLDGLQDDLRKGDTADQAVQWLREGKVIALLGIGGYQHMVDALNETAIAELRARKERKAKPLPILVADIAMAERFCILSDADRDALTSRAGPIIVVPQRPGCLPNNVAPGLSSIGVMLPTSSLHAYLANAVGPIIATSGNREGIPIAYRHPDDEPDLLEITPHIIFHNREIIRPIDDSVVQCIDQQTRSIRLARGRAPLSLPSPCRAFAQAADVYSSNSVPVPKILAIGGHQKVAIAIYNGEQAVLGPHLGDMDSLESRRRFAEHVQDWLELYHFEPECIVTDLHSDYFTTRWADDFARERNLPKQSVQHHHAHVVSGMIESNWLDRQVLGIAWDGTGAGPDGTVWGGEFLRCSVRGFERLACFRPFLLPGGERAIRQPKRIAEWLLKQARGHSSVQRPTDVVTSSAGRLFDAVAALIVPEEIVAGGQSYEGHFAALLESLADADETGCYSLPLVPSETLLDVLPEVLSNRTVALPPYLLDWSPLLRDLIEDVQRGTHAARIAMRFHRALAHGIVDVCQQFASLPVVLSGGVFQNRLLSELVINELRACQREFCYPQAIPVNDGGLAAGQLFIAANELLAQSPSPTKYSCHDRNRTLSALRGGTCA